MKIKLITLGLLIVSGTLMGCGTDTAQTDTADPVASSNSGQAVESVKADEPSPTSTMAVSENNEITPDALGNLSVSSIGDTLKFNSDSVLLPKGTEINVIFKNESVGLEHNWVVINKEDKDAVLADAIAAGPDSEWLKPEDSRVLAYTKLVKPGETDNITFTTPDSGTLLAICTFPGHAAGGMVSDIAVE